MGEYHVCGQKKLSGELSIGGGKNAILPILAATILNGDTSVITNFPKILDTTISIEILEALGCKTKVEKDTLIVNSKPMLETEVPANLVKKMRSSFIFLGGVLGRFKKVRISYPGGCELGSRPVDLHLKALRQMNVNITEEHGFINCETDRLIGAKINLDFPSVGATENIMLAAVFAEGETIINCAAKEPEICDLQVFLNGCGAKVKGAGTDTIVIEGVKKLHGVEHIVMPDRIVAGTYLVAAAITKGSVTLTNVNPAHLYPITSKLLETGCIVKEEKNIITLQAPGKLKSVNRLVTLPHPGFPTDMQPQLMALLSIANGTSVIEETLFESRNKHISELTRMGANILVSTDGKTFIIRGVKKLKGATVSSKDLRGGAALILAGLTAEGNTIVTNSEHIERGYDSIEKALQQMGASIKFVD